MSLRSRTAKLALESRDLRPKLVPLLMHRHAAYSLNVATVPLAKARAYAERVFEENGQKLDDVLPDFDKNYLALQKKAKAAPNIPRIQMPVIEPADMDLFNKRLNEGRLDIFAPYAKGKLVAPSTMSRSEGEEWVDLGIVDGNPRDDVVRDDVVRGKKTKIPAGKLLPTQGQIWLEKLVNNIARFGRPGPGSSILNAPVIASQEGYILDGHHRFGQAMLADPSLALAALFVPLNIDKLLEIGRAYGAAIGNKPKQAAAGNPKSIYDKLPERLRPFAWSTPAPNPDRTIPEAWRVPKKENTEAWLKTLVAYPDVYADFSGDKFRGREQLWIGLRDNRNKEEHAARLEEVARALAKAGGKVRRMRGHLLLVDDLERDVLRKASTREAADPWSKLPKGWTKESLKSFWDSLTAKAPKHKVTLCMKKMKDTGMEDPGAFCASLADKMIPGWREEAAKERAKKGTS